MKVDGVFAERRSALAELHENIKAKRVAILAQIDDVKGKREALMGRRGFPSNKVPMSQPFCSEAHSPDFNYEGRDASFDTSTTTSSSESCKISSNGLYITDENFSYEQYLKLIVRGKAQ